MNLNLNDRRRMATTLRHLASGQISVEEFEQVWGEVDDDVAWRIGHFAWSFYDDFKTERLRGAWKLSADSARIWARCVLFLLTNRADVDLPEFEPLDAGPLWARLLKWNFSYSVQGKTATDVWPFSTQDDLILARSIRNPFDAN